MEMDKEQERLSKSQSMEKIARERRIKESTPSFIKSMFKSKKPVKNETRDGLEKPKRAIPSWVEPRDY
jgi:hypothetical protein